MNKIPAARSSIDVSIFRGAGVDWRIQLGPTRRTALAKGRGGRGREEKKPKAEKKAGTVASTFLRPQPADPKAAAKEKGKNG
jgi:hypothetical protein